MLDQTLDQYLAALPAPLGSHAFDLAEMRAQTARADMAEKRLAEAAALLERLNTWNETEGSTDDLVCICRDSVAFLSATHSPPAEPAPCYSCKSTTSPRSPCPLCGKVVCRLCAEAEGESCCDAEPAPSLVEQIEAAIRAILNEGHPYSKGAAEAVGILRAIQRAAREAGGR